jgi:hypothetical protein
MIFDKGKKLTDTLEWPGASEEDSTPGMSGQSIMPTQVTTGQTKPKGSSIAPNHQGHNKVPLGHQLQEAEGAEVSEEDIEISPRDCIVFLWRRQSPHHKNVPSHDSEVERDCRS